MSELPTGWVAATLQDVATWSSGGTPSRSVPAYFSGNVPWIKTGELGPRVLMRAEEHISIEAVAASSAKVFPKGSVAVAMYGATIGKTSILGIEAATNQACAVGVPEATGAEFLYYFLLSQEQAFSGAGKGGAQPNISQGIIRSWPLSLPPLTEQSRIVAKLEELLSDLDAGVAELKAAQKKLAQYRQSLLKAAVEGALTADWRTRNPPTETGAQLLQRILTERRARWETKQLAKFKEQGKAPPKDWQKKYPEPVQPDTTGLPELPEGWVWVCLDALIDDGPQNGLYLPASQYGKGVPILRIDDYQIGWHRCRSALNLVDADEKTVETYAMNVRDLVINRVNSTTHLGKCLCIGEAMSGVLFESNMMRLHLSEHVTADYVALYLGSDLGRGRLISGAKWAVNQASINQQDVKRTPIPFPSQAEQHRITELLSSQLDAMEQQSTAIEIARRQSTAQRQNILRAAFAGQLVPQDPNDEPASVLLERIRAMREGQRPRSAGGRRSKGSQ